MTQNTGELFNAIASFLSDGFIASDEPGKITFINNTIEKITGWNLKELIGQDVSKVYSLLESNTLKLSPDNAPMKSQAAILFKKDGKKITVPAKQIEIKDLKEKNKKGYLTIFFTDSSLNSNVDRAHLEFVSTVSHELRTPLTSIKGFADTLLRTKERLPEDTQKKYIKIIRDQADRLTRLVEDLLAVSRLESQTQQLTIRAVDLQRAINSVCESLSSRSSHKIIQNLEKDLPPVLADADRLEQILTNLIDNAIKYSPDASMVTLAVSSLKNNNGIKEKIKIEVTDHGIGIKESDLPKIFTKFGRLDNPLTRQSEGTGLGLFITKSLVLALKGDISVKSKQGETTFTVILPAVIPAEGILLEGAGDTK